MKILLVLPYSKSYQISPDLGLGYLASVLERKGHNVSILNCVNKKITNKKLLEYVKLNKPDVIGFKVFTKDVDTVKEASRIIKEYRSDIYIIGGGPHPSCLPKNTLIEMKDLDFCFYSDAEIGLSQLINILNEANMTEQKLRDVPNLVWRDKYGAIEINKAKLTEDLDSTPFPLWKLMDPWDYPPAPLGFMLKSFPPAPIIATRGCPFECTFCCGWRMGGRKIRRRSPDNVVSEIIYLHNNFSINEIHFVDDNLTFNRDYAVSLCGAIKKLDFKLHWAIPDGVRLDTLDEDLLYLMKNSGCYSFGLGIESGSQRILNDTKKRQSLELIREKVKLIHKVGIHSMGFFMIGYPTETIEDIKATISFSHSLPLDYASFHTFQPYPGTEIYEILKRENRLGNIPWSSYSVDRVPWDKGNHSHRELKNLQRYATLSFYLRPRALFRFLSRIRTWGQIKFLIKRVISVVVKN